MKKIILLLLAVILIAGCSAKPAAALEWKATTDITVGVSNVKAGTFLDLKDSNALLVGGIIPIISWQDVISADLGLATDLNNKPLPLASISLDVQKFASKLGLTYKLLDPLAIGCWYGRTADDGKMNVEHYGLMATISYSL